jgi:hypothetical protein
MEHLSVASVYWSESTKALTRLILNFVSTSKYSKEEDFIGVRNCWETLREGGQVKSERVLVLVKKDLFQEMMQYFDKETGVKISPFRENSARFEPYSDQTFNFSVKLPQGVIALDALEAYAERFESLVGAGILERRDFTIDTVKHTNIDYITVTFSNRVLKSTRKILRMYVDQYPIKVHGEIRILYTSWSMKDSGDDEEDEIKEVGRELPPPLRIMKRTDGAASAKGSS